ncbi:MAG: hypothetical protein IJK45_08100 [Bacteroidaceae bacterium]|nr:hypothetical protein [Bacteroidaceae bacterium]
MKKFLLSLIALLGVVSANAQELSIADVQIVPGSQATFAIVMNNETEMLFRDSEFHFSFPAGISPVGAAKGDQDLIPGDNLIDGDYRIAINDNSGKGIGGTFTVCYVTIEAEDGLAEGTYQATLTKAEMTAKPSADVYDVIKKNYENITFNIVVTNVLTLDENATSEFSVGVTANVLVKRTIKANTWNTIALPFAVKKDDFATIFGSDASVATFDSWNAEFVENEDGDYVPSAITINFKERKTSLATVLLAGTPYLVKTSKDISEFTMSQAALVEKKNVTSNFEEEEYIGETYNGAFVSTYIKTKVPNNGLFIRDSKFYYSSGETVLKGFRGYFDLGLVLDRGSQAGVKYSINVDGEETSVDGIEFVSSHGGVYTLDGKFVGRDVDLKKLQKGIYVIDGKKVAIK